MPAPKGHPPYNVNGEGGRPVKYDQAFIENEADLLEKWMQVKENIFLEDFCLERGYSYNRAIEWSKDNERFSVTYEMFQMRQKTILFKGGLSKKFAYPMCALILSHSHGIVAKNEQKLTGDPSCPLTFLLQGIDGTSKDLVSDDSAGE
ncbi:MAG: hypothetical protein LLG04_01310 [Parachlamydia sp.]|nr:hypothetical protein [Parachlamydia sp.]